MFKILNLNIHIYYNLSHLTKTTNYLDDIFLTFHILHTMLNFQTCPLTSLARRTKLCMKSYRIVHEIFL